MASPVYVCYDDPDVPWRFQKQWTAYARWLKRRQWHWETRPGLYIDHVMARVDKEGRLTCDERLSIVKRLAFKYSGAPWLSIKPHDHSFCICKLSRCSKRLYDRNDEKERWLASSKAATEFARANDIPHCYLPEFRDVYPTCCVCNTSFAKDKYDLCKSRSCNLLQRMRSDGLLDRKKTHLVDSFFYNKKTEYVELCYLTAVIERFISKQRPKDLNKFFKRYKGFLNVTRQN
jgi:hypothetical protein